MITKKPSYFLAQLWTYDNMTMALSCKNGEWEYQNFTWELPAIDTEGYIMDSLNGTVLSLENDLIEPGTRVVLKQVDPNSTETQKWIIIPMRNREGFFTIGLPSSEIGVHGRLLTLTMSNTTTTTIEGKVSIMNCCYCPLKGKKCSLFTNIF